MHRYSLSCSMEAGDLEPIVLAVHELVHRLPVTAKSLEKDGIRVEDGRVVDRHYTGPVLLEAIEKNISIKTTPATGAYKGVPVTVTPVMSGVPPPVRSIFITLEKSMPEGPRPDGLARNVLPIIDPDG